MIMHYLFSFWISPPHVPDRHGTPCVRGQAHLILHFHFHCLSLLTREDRQSGAAKRSRAAAMSHTESTLDGCLEGLPGPMRERIRSSRRVAIRQTGAHGRPQILHPMRNPLGGQHFEVWEQDQKQLGSGGNGCVVVLQSKVSPLASPGYPTEQLRAVKIIPVDDRRWKYYLRELDALIRFSDNKASS